MDSLIDFGKVASTAISLGELGETQRRNDLYQENVKNQEAETKLEERRLDQSIWFR